MQKLLCFSYDKFCCFCESRIEFGFDSRSKQERFRSARVESRVDSGLYSEFAQNLSSRQISYPIKVDFFPNGLPSS
jgi:hypothetical protein